MFRNTHIRVLWVGRARSRVHTMYMPYGTERRRFAISSLRRSVLNTREIMCIIYGKTTRSLVYASKNYYFFDEMKFISHRWKISSWKSNFHYSSFINCIIAGVEDVKKFIPTSNYSKAIYNEESRGHPIRVHNRPIYNLCLCIAIHIAIPWGKIFWLMNIFHLNGARFRINLNCSNNRKG